MKLVVVESPTKANTISKFLGEDFEVQPSYGHIRDLPKTTIGIDFDDNFKPRYRIPNEKRENVNDLKEAAKDAEEIIFATDEDREGEAIAWHLSKAMKINDFNRIVFHEITEEAIDNAIENPRDIDMNLVNAQQARRILDRIVGYKLSPFLWKKVANKLSAGRVQSVALRFVADREKERREFTPETYWTIEGLLNKDDSEFETYLYRLNGESLPKPGIKDEGLTEQIVQDIESSELTVSEFKKKDTYKKVPKPFITSTLQRSASKRLYFSAKQTMMFAQNLYEKGLITYMRTDSLNLAESSLKSARKWIGENLSDAYQLDSPRRFKTESETAQEAHEAIRPTNPTLHPEDLDIEGKEKKLYELIWRRFIASQLPPARYEQRTVNVDTEGGFDNDYILRSTGQVQKFDGFLKIWSKDYKEAEIPELNEGDRVDLKEIEAIEHETQPPGRYNESSLIKELEKNGVGRPSTYAPIISVIQERNYVVQDENRRFKPTEIGETVNNVLKEHFPKIVDVEFTAEMEEDLDKIAQGEKEWQEVVREFYEPFEENLEKKYEEVKKEDIVGKQEKVDEECPECGKPLVVRTSRFGKFLGCSGFPDCKYTKQLGEDGDSEEEGNESPKTEEKEEDLGNCPECEDGEIVKRHTRKSGKLFYGCSNYPDCDFATWEKEELKEAQKEAEEE